MSRNEEYRLLMAEASKTPEKLSYTVQRAFAREASEKRRRRGRLTAVSFTCCMAAFILLVNVFPTFAAACGRIPLIRELAQAVTWSPSLSAAVENEFVQPIGQSQREGDVTVSVEYVIVDRKQVNIFYQLESDRYERLDAEYDLTVPGCGEGYASSTGSFGVKNGELRRIDVDFIQVDVPDTLELTLRVYDSSADWAADAPPSEGTDYGDEMLDTPQAERRTYLAECAFTLRFDPYFTAKGETIPVGWTFTLDGQRITLEEAECYPTHLRLNFDWDGDNTAWLKGLNFYLENEHGERFETMKNGISAVGDGDTPGMTSFWVDSPFFSQGEHLTLCVTGAEWLDKDQQPVRVDLASASAEGLPEGIRIEWAEHRANGWILSASAPYRWESATMYSIWSKAYDGEGQEIEITQTSTTNTPMHLGALSGEALEEHEAYAAENQDRFFETFPLRNYHQDEVFLMPCWSRVTTQESPVRITIK